jgi:mono/diheme cytochrome c family protein
VIWDDYDQEWLGYQRTYHALALRLAKDNLEREWVKSQRLEIKQLQPEAMATVERCVTCHLAVDNSTLGRVPAPLRKHSALLDSHPPQRFGCTVCHGGEGRALRTSDAHGQGEVIAKPLLKGDYIQAACYECHGANTLPAKATASVVRGRQLMNRYLCLGCHQINGAGGDEGPDLSVVGSHRNWLWLYAHLARPQGVVVGSTMPVFTLRREEIKDITIFLMTLKDKRDRARWMPLRATRVVGSYDTFSGTQSEDTIPRPVPAADGTDKFEYQGEAVFRGAGCSLCHMVGTRGGEVGPALTYIGRKRTPKELERLLREPEDLLPAGKMPQLYLNEQQISALARYLSQLK